MISFLLYFRNDYGRNSPEILEAREWLGNSFWRLKYFVNAAEELRAVSDGNIHLFDPDNQSTHDPALDLVVIICGSPGQKETM